MKLFISYAHEDKDRCEQLIEHLEGTKRLHEIWYDGYLHGGENSSEEIELELLTSEGVIFLVSPAFLASEACQDEIDLAIRENKHKFLIHIKPDIRPEGLIDDLQYLALESDFSNISILHEAITNSIEHQHTNLNKKQRNLFLQSMTSKIIGNDSHWIARAIILAIVGTILTCIGTLWNSRCDGLPFGYKFVRDNLCTAPDPYPLQDFVVVSSKLLGIGNVDTRTVQSISLGIEDELLRSELPPELGTFAIVESSNNWIDAFPNIDSMRDAVRQQADLFNADVVIYGQVSQSQSILFEPAFYVRQNTAEDLLALIEVIDTENLGIQIPIREGQDVIVSNWVSAMRSFIIGLQLSRLDNSDITLQIRDLNAALLAFNAVPDDIDSDFYAISNLYAGNVALELAILEQIQYEQDDDNGCINGRCISYDDEIILRYLEAWNYYTVAVDSNRDDLIIRGLIGRGNIHYRLARLTRLTTDNDDLYVNYNCYDDTSLLEIEPDETVVSEINWVQRALIAYECYEQVIIRAEANSLIEVKGLLGAAQTMEWLGRERNDESHLRTGFDQYSRIIDYYASASDTEQLEDLECFGGFSYGQRAQIRWVSQDTTYNDIEELRTDLRTAIDILENSPANCSASQSVQSYQTDLDTLGG